MVELLPVSDRHPVDGENKAVPRDATRLVHPHIPPCQNPAMRPRHREGRDITKTRQRTYRQSR